MSDTQAITDRFPNKALRGEYTDTSVMRDWDRFASLFTHELEAFRKRTGWTFSWHSSFETEFNHDFHVSLDEAAGSREYNYQDASVRTQAGKLWRDELPRLNVRLRDGDTAASKYVVSRTLREATWNITTILSSTHLMTSDVGSRALIAGGFSTLSVPRGEVVVA
jgi:Bacterial protein of unknown function (DUF899)